MANDSMLLPDAFKGKSYLPKEMAYTTGMEHWFRTDSALSLPCSSYNYIFKYSGTSME
ncbi:hypothetical protein FOPG_08994 [Fusarium oxysporum f. sp. conglutinans race 2 54008]|uniref:Uncharacterized protein n=1 Tax=Fusarium oxysporum f. sp. conglutinans race 2 54008 TaxID=1089457 RepID=X0HWR5_FUSOX|nr:hypothetical protein FOPG_08994 [Fusarium oxysporum f. sp. conglutinans race 2 54008]KAI8404188.1 hypothetical protein FOFC_15683 [Fusarium oxysporum]